MPDICSTTIAIEEGAGWVAEPTFAGRIRRVCCAWLDRRVGVRRRNDRETMEPGALRDGAAERRRQPADRALPALRPMPFLAMHLLPTRLQGGYHAD
ncbi:hypothetical protein ASF73_09465 [Xanthomonas sp. Leaf131]|nr:hypothetical protein ASF73_09465 [Xanthomonas sp. Leaf131]